MAPLRTVLPSVPGVPVEPVGPVAPVGPVGPVAPSIFAITFQVPAVFRYTSLLEVLK